MADVTAIDLPAGTLLEPWRASATFRDTYEAPLSDPGLTPLEIYRRVSEAAPGWATTLMAIRNRVVAPLGLKTGPGPDAGVAAHGPYEVGDRIGLFTIYAMTADELVIGVDDRHLDVRLSVMKRGGRYALSTVVRTHNLLGRIYMLPVGRIHPVIVRAMMGAARV